MKMQIIVLHKVSCNAFVW